MKRNAIFLTEGGGIQGLGHIARCLSVAEGFKKSGILTKIILDGDRHLVSPSKNLPITVKRWKNKNLLPDLLRDVDIAVIDSYAVSQELIDQVSFLVPVPLFIDDNVQQKYRRGLVLNGNLYGPSLNYPQIPGLELLLGAKFTPLRAAFQKPFRPKVAQKITRVLIMFGGTDVRQLTFKTAKIVKHALPNVALDIVIRKDSNQISSLERLSQAHLHDSVTDIELRHLMSRCDVAIGSAGQTLHELARMGVPVMATAVAENQLNNLKTFTQKKLIRSLGWYASGSWPRKIEQSLAFLAPQKIRQQFSKSARRVLDGQGPQRIAKAVLRYQRKFGLRIQMAEPGDVKDVLILSNEKAVRASSFSTKKIALAEHRVWFNSQLKDKNTLFMVARTQDGKLVGQMRLKHENNVATLSISVSQKTWGKSVGKLLFHKTIAEAKKRWDLKWIHAYVKADNKRSLNFFITLGFSRESITRVDSYKTVFYRLGV